MFAKIPRPSRIALTIVAKLSSARIMSAASLRDVGAGDAHRDADVGGLQRRRVVHAVAGHRDDPTVRVQRLDDPQLVLRRDAGVDARPPARLPCATRRRRASRARAPVTTRDPAGAMPRSAAIRAAVRGWSPVIISTRTPADVRVGDGGTGLRPRRVDDPDQPEEDELPLDRLVLRRRLVRRQRPVGDRKRAQRQVGEPVDRREDLAPARLGKRPHTAAEALLGAAGEQHVGRALGDDGDAVTRARGRRASCSSACARR